MHTYRVCVCVSERERCLRVIQLIINKSTSSYTNTHTHKFMCTLHTHIHTQYITHIWAPKVPNVGAALRHQSAESALECCCCCVP